MVLVGLLVLVGLFTGAAWINRSRLITIHARMAEAGGWLPGELTARVGESLRLQLVSDDVTHSFAVGQMEMDPVDLFPGEVQEISLTFDKPGKYTYYCTRWCGPNHWRMRGTIDVQAQDSSEPETAPKKPLYLTLGIDIDAPHRASVTPKSKPDAAAVNDPFGLLAEVYRTPFYYHTHSPAEAWQDLRLEPHYHGLSDEQIWTLVGAIWQLNTTSAELAQGKELYVSNCAACHGSEGAGDGVFAGQSEISSSLSQPEMEGQGLKTPADFTDAESMLGASPTLLQGKILRGGMGTGMPYWGPIFTDEQVWALVSYLYTFQFTYTWEVK